VADVPSGAKQLLLLTAVNGIDGICGKGAFLRSIPARARASRRRLGDHARHRIATHDAPATQLSRLTSPARHPSTRRRRVARKQIYVSDLSGEAIEEGKGATVTIKFNDARRGASFWT
jgi:hypothetical protein